MCVRLGWCHEGHSVVGKGVKFGLFGGTNNRDIGSQIWHWLSGSNFSKQFGI